LILPFRSRFKAFIRSSRCFRRLALRSDSGFLGAAAATWGLSSNGGGSSVSRISLLVSAVSAGSGDVAMSIHTYWIFYYPPFDRRTSF
jgi:hypothetical protein